MNAELPQALLSALREGRAVLFLGAGASSGARAADGDKIPTAQELADLLAGEFLDDTFKGEELRVVYDLACSERDVRTVQKRMFEILNRFQPAQHHLLVPTFPWAGIATTNYDLLVERAYQQATAPIQALQPNVNDSDGAAEQLTSRSVLYIKLHGCITRHHEVAPPLVTSTEQLIAYRAGRKGQFDSFLEWAKTKTIIFTGYSFRDANMRKLLDEIIKEGDNRPRHYMVNPGITAIEARYWRERRIETTSISFETLMGALDDGIEKRHRALGAVVASPSKLSTLSRFITTREAQETSELRNYLDAFVEHIGPELDPAADEPKRFYSGFELGWYPISADLDVRQPIVDDVLSEHVAAASNTGKQTLVVIKGHAGSGKSVVLRRICWEAAKRYGRLCLFVARQHLIKLECFEEIFRLSNLPVFLFVDNLADQRDNVLALYERAKALGSELVIIGTETYPIWNVLCEELEPVVTQTYDMRYLSERNIRMLVEKLEMHGSLGYLQKLTLERRVHELQHVHGRQLLVALLEATHGTPLEEIVANEYRSLPSNLARILYLDICSLYRFGAPVRAGLIARIHNITFDDFSDRLFRPLQGVVILKKDYARSGDYMYEARHPFIAHTVYEVAVTAVEEKFENITRILSKLNPSYSYDMEVMGKVLRSENLVNTVGDHHKVRQIYDLAEETFGPVGILFHQRGIFEMSIARTSKDLERAERYLARAEETTPRNRAIRHSFAELDLRRSRLATDMLQRQAWRQKAVTRASELARGTSPYPFHTMLKAAVDEIKDVLKEVEGGERDVDARALGESIAKAESVLRRGLEAFPNEPILLSEEGVLSNVLSQAVRAEGAFERAFASNPRSTLTAIRLSRIKRAKKNFDEARTILQTCLEHNPGAHAIHFQLAMTIMEGQPDADQIEDQIILRHLRRASAGSGRNRQAKFWYARQLSLMGQYDQARTIFRELSESRIPYREKKEIRGVVLCADGSPNVYTGTITRVRGGTFLRCDEPQLSAYFSAEDLDSRGGPLLAVGDVVQFELAFNLLGPVAQRLRV